MNMLNRIHTLLFASAVLLTCAVAHADDLQDANKLFKQGQQAQAMEKVNNYLASKPKDAQGRFLKGLILTEQNKPNDAIKVFSDLTVDYPDLPEPYNNLAVLYAGQGQYEKAKQSLELAIRTHPSYATAHENLGDIYAKMASQAYDRALQLDKGNTATQTKLAMIQDLFSGNSRPKASTTRPAATQVATANETTAAPTNTAPPAAQAVTSAASKPAANVAAAKNSGGDDSDAVVKSVHEWAAAWSSKNVNKYLAHYADDFHPADGESRSAWAETRRERINAPKSIHVSLSDVTVKFSDSNHATAHFRQAYQASHLHTSSGKTLSLVNVNGKWLIQEERTK
ncbi:MAG: tetratricopeptide repeat protein [Gallionella sp.]